MADKARISSDEVRKAAAETESELWALLKAEQLSLFGGDPHHVGYTRTNARGTVSNIAAKNPRAKAEEATVRAKRSGTQQDHIIAAAAHRDAAPQAETRYDEADHKKMAEFHDMKARDAAPPSEQTPDRHALQRNIEQLAAEKGMDPIALISQLQTGATASGRHKLVGLLGAIKGRYIKRAQKAEAANDATAHAERSSELANDMNDPVSHEEAAAAHTAAADAHYDPGEVAYHRAKASEHLLAAQTADDEMASPEHSERSYDHNGVEAYGQKGMKNTVWRKLFKDADELHAWTEKNDASVLGTRGLTDFEAHPKSKGGKEQLAAMRKKPPVAKTPAASHLTGEAYWKESHKKIESALSGMNLPGVKTKVRRNENMVTVSIRPTDDVPGGATLVAHGQETMSGQQHRRNKEMVSSAAKAIEQRLKGTGINIEDIAAEENSVFLVLHNTQKVAKSLREEITSATMLLKSHVKAYQRTTASGASVTVKEHDDSRQKHPSPWNAHHAAVHKLGVAMEAGGNSEDGYHIQVAAKHMKNGDKKAFTQHMEGSGNFMYEQVLPHIHPDHWKELGGNPIDKERSTKEFEKRHPVKGGAGKNAHKLGSKMTQAYDRFHKEDTKTEKKFNKLNSKLTR
jgi:hypothetical protein